MMKNQKNSRMISSRKHDWKNLKIDSHVIR